MSHPSQPAKPMEDTGRQPLDFSGCSDSTSDHHQPPHYSPTTVDDCQWNSSSDDDYHKYYFPNLIESVLYQGGASTLLDPSQSFITFQTPCTSSSSDTMCNTPSDKDLKGLRLVHLLVAAAEALNGPIRSRELARVILLRLKDLVSANCGTNIERLAAHFTDALQGLLNGSAAVWSGGTDNYRFRFHQIEVLAAFQILQDVSPYIKFGHFTANQAILETVAGDRRIHIVDYNIMEGIQWASLMQALVSREEGTPPPHLRITALSRGGGHRRSLATVQETGRRLVAFAESIGQPFSFHQHRLDSDERFKPDGLKLYRGEALVINCMLHASHSGDRGSESVASFLSGSRTLNPRLVTLAEEESVCIQAGGFIGWFIDLLHRYSALYDSLEAGFPMNGWARGLVERVFLGPRIVSSVAGVYRTHGAGEGWWLWREWLSAVGYREVSVSFANHCQAKLLLGLFNGGYRVEELAVNALVLGWKSRNLVSASVWTTDSES